MTEGLWISSRRCRISRAGGRATPTLTDAGSTRSRTRHLPLTQPRRLWQVQRSRVGKVSIGVWVDPAVRKQLAQIALDNR